MQTTTTESRIHPWERAGLGPAPYRCVGNHESKHQAVPGDPSCPVKPGSACDYCAQGIMDVYVIQAADGTRFKVGCECVRRVAAKGDRVLTEVDRLRRRTQRNRRHARERARDERTREALERDDVREALQAEPHPLEWRAEKGGTLLEWAEWMMANAGASGRARVARVLRGLTASR